MKETKLASAAIALFTALLLMGVTVAAVGCGSGGEGESVETGWPVFAVDAKTLFPISDGGLVGYIGRDGAVALSPRFAEGGQFSEGLAAVRMRSDAPWGFVDQTGEMIIEPRFAEAEPFSEGLAAVREATDGPWGFVDITGNLVIGLRFGSASSFSEGLARVSAGVLSGYVDMAGEWVITLERLEAVGGFSGGLALVYDREIDRYGYIDYQGDLSLGARFLEAWDFSEGVAAVRPATEDGGSGLYGYIDKDGDWLIEPQFADARPFSLGLAAVQSAEGGDWGYVDVTGAVSIESRWAEAGTFDGGLALVSLIVGVDDEGASVYGYAYIDLAGDIVWQDRALAGFDPTAPTTTTVFTESTTSPDGGGTPSTVIYD